MSTTLEELQKQQGASGAALAGKARQLLLKGPLSLVELADKLDCSPKVARGIVTQLEAENHNIRLSADTAEIVRDVPQGGKFKIDPALIRGRHIRFGAIGDTHLGSKYERLDVLESLYDWFAENGIQVVYHSGNMVEGYGKLNKFDVIPGCESVDGQLRYNAKHYAQREGIKTFFIAGDDHEGWWVQREGVNIGQMIQDAAEQAGRSDLVYLSYMEADLLFPAEEGQTWGRVIHPGGGSAYATSYTAQKYVECVPLDSEILTPTGWKKHDEIKPGDSVLGYNVATGRCEWTVLRAVNRYSDAQVVQYENDQFRVRCTPDHRWAMEWESRGGRNPNSAIPVNYARRERLLCTIDEAKERSRIIQAAPGPDGEGARFDEHVSILNRADAVQVILRMTSAQRQAFIYGMMVGEGSFNSDGGTLSFSQRPGPIQDAFSLACFLEGRATGIARLTSKKVDGSEKVCCRTTVLKKPQRMVTRSLRPVAWQSGQEVWCPSTGLGTWVMRQGELITITGNSLQGGEKPAFVLIGHYHKMEYGRPREVLCFQTGCTQDQTPFMRKKRLEAQLGGWIIDIEQAPDGHVASVTMSDRRFYDRKFYERTEKFPRW